MTSVSAGHIILTLTLFVAMVKIFHYMFSNGTIHTTDISNRLYCLIHIVFVCVCLGVFTHAIKPAILAVFDRPLHTYEKE